VTRKPKPLSVTMAIAIGAVIEHGGKLIRHPGGYWSWPGCPRRQHDGVPEAYFGSLTVHALVERGELEYTEWRDGRDKRFPIAAAVPAEGVHK
jgi:hypothetical protein